MMFKCLRCKNDHDGIFGSGKFCSRSCANSRGTRTDEFKRNISEKLKGLPSKNKGKKLSIEHRQKISDGLKGKVLGKSPLFSNEEVFIENSTYPRKDIKRRILKYDLIKYSCVLCNNDGEWNNSKLVLQLDHINGVNNDHRIENLRFLCPNCHTQQTTYAAKNRSNPNRQPKKYS